MSRPGALVLFALGREAGPFRRFARSRGATVAVTGVGQAAARRGAEAALSTLRPTHVVMAGFCGALRPGLAPGDIVVPLEIVDERGGSWAGWPDGRERLLTVDRLVGQPEAKRLLAARYSAAAVDMETATVARLCAERGVPFSAVRAVSDDADAALSPELVELLAGGRVSVWAACTALMRKPALLREFRRLARDTKLAARNLAEALAEHLGGTRVTPTGRTAQSTQTRGEPAA